MGLEGFAGRRAGEVTVVGQGQFHGSSLRPDFRGGRRGRLSEGGRGCGGESLTPGTRAPPSSATDLLADVQ